MHSTLKECKSSFCIPTLISGVDVGNAVNCYITYVCFMQWSVTDSTHSIGGENHLVSSRKAQETTVHVYVACVMGTSNLRLVCVFLSNGRHRITLASDNPVINVYRTLFFRWVIRSIKRLRDEDRFWKGRLAQFPRTRVSRKYPSCARRARDWAYCT